MLNSKSAVTLPHKGILTHTFDPIFQHIAELHPGWRGLTPAVIDERGFVYQRIRDAYDRCGILLAHPPDRQIVAYWEVPGETIIIRGSED